MKTVRLDDTYFARIERVKMLLNETGIDVNDSTVFRSIILNGLENIENKLDKRIENDSKGKMGKG